ncbi:unnamed protein product [Adineta ricciae]|uniref:GDSL esterase/lipase n=1 Tax=Adineta ricciae TaxID=249248 RepID=A0A815WFH3_ADIRI|nr:unnamed protein product [Adineta ricciae]CAF1670523.1 unnamed protein product [Adineta ricciae]
MAHPQPSYYSESPTASSPYYLQNHSSPLPLAHRFSHLSLSSAGAHHSSGFPPMSLERDRRFSDYHPHSPALPIQHLSLNSPNHHHSQSLSTHSTLRPAFLLLTDSHGRFFPPLFETSEYSITTKSISGLSWLNSYNSSLCTSSLLISSSFSTDIATFSRVLFLIGSNSIRTTRAPVIIQQITSLIDCLRHTYPHLAHPAAIGIIYTFPCYKPSRAFPTLSSLHSNLTEYNSLLRDLACSQNFLLLDLFVAPTHLSRDGLHLHPSHCSMIWSSIMTYFASSVRATHPSSTHETVALPLSRTHTRSRTALTSRNRKRHRKLRLRQQCFVVVRNIDPLWRLSDVRNYLDHQQIIYANIPNFRHQQVSIRFHNLIRQEHAERTLSPDAFDAAHYHLWKCHGH